MQQSQRRWWLSPRTRLMYIWWYRQVYLYRETERARKGNEAANQRKECGSTRSCDQKEWVEIKRGRHSMEFLQSCWKQNARSLVMMHTSCWYMSRCKQRRLTERVRKKPKKEMDAEKLRKKECKKKKKKQKQKKTEDCDTQDISVWMDRQRHALWLR